MSAIFFLMTVGLVTAASVARAARAIWWTERGLPWAVRQQSREPRNPQSEKSINFTHYIYLMRLKVMKNM